MTKEQIQQFSLDHAEPTWLADLRQAAFEQIDRLALPTIERVKFHRWNLGDGTITENEALGNVPDFTSLDNNPKLVQVGTQTVLEQLPADLAQQGVVFTDLYSALEMIPEVIEKHFGTAVSFDEDKLSAYNAAYFNATAVLYIPDNVVVEQPIEGIYYQDSSSPVPFNKRVLIIAGKNSQVNYLERFESLGAGGVATSANITVEVLALAGSQVKFSAIDRLGKHVTTFMNRRGRLANDASIDWALGIMNEGNVVADFDSDLIGKASHANLKVVALSSGRQVQGIDSRVTNYGPHSVGHILQHGVILERGTLTFNGIGHIIRGAKGADAQQESRVLMLSDKARSDANPILLIDENEVTAGHAASIGQVDPEDMYYLMSRGLDQATAERLVIRGFLGSVITEIPVKEVRDEMIQVIEDKLTKREYGNTR
ncbi:Fe-S cluster assembly protein SufD [Streptococcus minor]|uniref:Fe-S cluster assembly protein SufD n=1 Tax=Streptococcus minor TaxID=229549 RepID=UPI00035F8EB5|nr:Fe-S cluster assembly protein SufD [Streptococcus minor]